MSAKKLKLYGVERPDGSLVEIRPTETEDSAMNAAASVEGNRDDGPSLFAACYRAAGGGCNWTPSVANEIGRLMGYKVVVVKVVRP